MKHILIVEDDAGIRGVLMDALADAGYSVCTASTGRDALEQMHARLPDLVLLDLMLPEMNGWSFLRAREGERQLLDVPVLVVSAAEPAGLRIAQDLGAPIYLHKPFDIDELLAAVKRLCAGPVRQCAWCGQVMDQTGAFRLHSGRNLRWASHGICQRCKEAEWREVAN